MRGVFGDGAAAEERSEVGAMVVESGIDRVPEIEAAEFLLGA